MKFLANTKINSHLEIKYYESHCFKKVFYYILLVLTFGLFKYYFDCYKYHFYKKSTPEKSTHVKITNTKKNEITFKKLEKKRIMLIPYAEKTKIIYFIYKYRLYYYSNKYQSFLLVRNKVIKNIDLNPDLLQKYENGLTDDQSQELLKSYGKNIIEVPKQTFFTLLIDQCLSPITLYQLLCCLFWYFDFFETYSCILFILIIIPVITSAYETSTHNQKTREMAYQENLVIVKRNGKFVEISSKDISIGDIIKIESDTTLPCDIVLLKGKSIVREGMLTGESGPIIKFPYNPILRIQPHNLLLAGTECLMSKYNEEEAIGLVVNTGFYTFKGDLVRSLLLKETEGFNYIKDIFYILIWCFCLALIAFIFYVTFELSLQRVIIPKMTVVLRGLEFFATSIPPTLPLCLTIGLSFAISKLSRHGIETQNPNKINEAGRVKIMCFDKTGTLTETSLNFKGFMTIENDYLEHFKKDVANIDDFDENYIRIIEMMGMCHSLTYLERILVGDPLEIEMFYNSHFEMIENNIGGQSFRPDSVLKNILDQDDFRYTKIRAIDFTPNRKRFSCVVKDEKKNKYFLFTKGSIDVIIKLSKKKSLPKNLNEKISLYSHEGYRILGFAYKELQENELNLEVDEIEKRLNFQGLIFFENPLKPSTRSVIKELKRGGIKNIMITGDNLLTSLNVAINSGIVSKSKYIWSGDLKEDKIEWKKIINRKERRSRLKPEDTMDIEASFEEKDDVVEIVEVDIDLKIILKNCEMGHSNIILTGDAFECLYQTKQNFNFNLLLKNTLVYGRSAPEQKALIVKCYKKYLKKTEKEQFFVGFCGDGANDCPALKMANVGLSISDLEASIAAPFTCSFHDISSVPNLLREGKASLYTGIQNFKFLITYAMIYFFAMIINFIYGIDFSDGEYYIYDFFFFVPISIIMNNTDSKRVLTKNYPPIEILKCEILTSIIGSNLIMLVGFVSLNVFLFHSERFLPIEFIGVDFLNYSENYYFFNISFYHFLFISFVTLILGIVLNNKRNDFKKSWYTNKVLVLSIFLHLSFFFIIVFIRTEDNYGITFFFNKFIRKLDYDFYELTFVLTLIGIFTVLMVIFEENIVFITKLMKGNLFTKS